MAKKRQRIVTPQDLSRMTATLYPADRWKARPPSFRFDFTRIQHGGIVGICLDRSSWRAPNCRAIVRDYALEKKTTAGKVLEELRKKRTTLLLLDLFNYEWNGWIDFLQVALHEYAHFIRGTLKSAYKIPPATAANLEESLEVVDRLQARMRGTGRYRPYGRLFGRWCFHYGKVDTGVSHDPLFYFVLYLLERKAQDLGYFDLDAKPEGAKPLYP
jgi:hypothetical protein